MTTQQTFREHQIVTQHEFKEFRTLMEQNFIQFKTDMRHSFVQLESKLTIKMGTMLAATIGILTAIQKLT